MNAPNLQEANGASRAAEDLAKELAAVKNELMEVRQERDDYLRAVYGYLEKEFDSDLENLDLEALRAQAVFEPTLEQSIDELTQELDR